MPNISSNIFINALFILGIVQVSWLFYALLRKGIQGDSMWQATPPLLAIWVLLWPVYSNTSGILFPIGVCTALLAITYLHKHRFLMAMRPVWGTPYPWRALSLWLSLGIALYFFQQTAEFGFALALIACFAFPLADILDRIPNFKPLGLPLHPRQTLLGHLALICSITALSSWSVHLYQPLQWELLIFATIIAATAASLIRALLPSPWYLPIATLSMGLLLQQL